jgi:hypothetical protein
LHIASQVAILADFPYEVFMSADPITIFRKTWGTYQKVISHNLMFHRREITTAVAKLFESRNAKRYDRNV